LKEANTETVYGLGVRTAQALSLKDNIQVLPWMMSIKTACLLGSGNMTPQQNKNNKPAVC
jgi:hypothetical protein